MPVPATPVPPARQHADRNPPSANPPGRNGPPEQPGEFEAHVTLACSPTTADTLEAWAARHGADLAHIVLHRGHHRQQPMLTLRGTTTLTRARRAARDLAARARGAGHRVVRVKLEVAPGHPAVPRTAGQARMLGPGRYFEHHVKVLLAAAPDAAAHAALSELALAHGGHLSHNARRTRGDGRQERFVTQRRAGVGDPEAARACHALATALRAAGHPVLSVVREYVWDDDNAELDAGWLPAAPGDGPAGRPN